MCGNVMSMYQLKLTQIGNSVGVILPKELLAQLGVSKGETLFAVPEPDGYCLTALDPGIARQVEMAEGITRRYRDTLKKLAE